MDSTSTPKSSIRRAAAAGALIFAIALAGCATPAGSPAGPAAPVPAVKQAPRAPMGIDTDRPADRVAEDIERNRDRQQELSKRFAGVPADRIEEELRRKAVGAQGWE